MRGPFVIIEGFGPRAQRMATQCWVAQDALTNYGWQHKPHFLNFFPCSQLALTHHFDLSSTCRRDLCIGFLIPYYTPAELKPVLLGGKWGGARLSFLRRTGGAAQP